MKLLKDNPVARMRRAVRNQGMLPFLKRRFSVTCNQLFRARLCVWVWNHGDPLADGSDDVRIERFAIADQLPAGVLDELTAGDGESFVPRMHEEFAEGGVLWVGFLEGRVAGYQWSRRGHYVRDWHLDLDEADVLIYSTVTFYEFRGRNVGPTLMANICREDVSPGGRACADCMVWNTPAVRFIQKTGFTKVAERKPLQHHPD